MYYGVKDSHWRPFSLWRKLINLIFTLKQFIISHSNLDLASSAGIAFCNSTLTVMNLRAKKEEKKRSRSVLSPFSPLSLKQNSDACGGGLSRPQFINRELKQLRRGPQRQLQKTIGLMIKTTALQVHHPL